MSTKIYSLDENFPQSSIETIVKANNQRLIEAYKELFNNPENKTKIDKLVAETREMIPQIDERIHYWEDRRTQFLQLSIGILAASLAGFVAITPLLFENLEENGFFSLSSVLYIPALILSLFLIIGGTKLVILWNKQNNPPYPFTKGTKTWRWQYRHAETTETDTNFQNYSSKDFEKQAYIFANNLIDYKIRSISSDEIELLDQDLSQLYLLLINEKFKIKFVSKLRDMFINWLLIAGIAGASGAILMVLGVFLTKTVL